MEIILARHGNTFGPGDKVVWVGRESDLPLVPAGEDQARNAATALLDTGRIPELIVCAGLKRTRRFAEIVAEMLGLTAPETDSRLDEIDYGPWAGRTNAEIEAEGESAAQALAAWNDRDVWPEGYGWKPGEAAIKAAMASFVGERLATHASKRILVVSSNGILRFLIRALVPNESRMSFKMRTGRLALVTQDADTAQLICWDSSPDEFRAAAKALDGR